MHLTIKSSKIPSPIAYSREGGKSSFPTPRDSLAKIETPGGGGILKT